MSDTLTAAPSAATGAPATADTTTTTAPQSVAEAGAALKSAASWDDLPFGSMDVTDGGEPEPTGEAPAGELAPEQLPAPDEGPEFSQNAQGQWHRPDGTFANAEEIAKINAQLAADATAAAATPAVEQQAATENIVTLRRRDGTTREVVIDDPELADEIRANHNDGMRRKEFAEKSAALDAKLAHINQIDALIDTNPELVIQQSLTDEQQISLAQMLLARHFDRLVPIIQGFDTDPGKRIEETAAVQRRISEQQTTFTQRTQAAQQASECRVAVESLIPENADQQVVQQFMQDAIGDLSRAITTGQNVTKDTVPQLLAARMKLYGFEAADGQPSTAARPRVTLKPPASPTASTTTTVAQPANDPAKAFAETQANQTRLRLTQRNRMNAAAVPPVGAGAPPVRLPAVPKNASIEDASRALKKMKTWAS